MKKSIISLLLLVSVFTGFLLFVKSSNAYVPLGSIWTAKSMTYLVNTSSMTTITAAPALADLQMAASAWTTQTGANWSFVYGGTTAITGFRNDGSNVVFFTQDTNGASGDTYLAFTTCWWSGSTMLDCDIKFREAAAIIYTTDQICDPTAGFNGGYYLLDMATHEFGHALGLLHTDVVDATMHIGIGACDTRDRTLESDDIAGIQSLYGLIATPGPSPSPSPTPTPSPIPSPPPPSGAILTLRAYKVRGLQKVDLTWTGLTTSTVDIYRNNQKIAAGTLNDGLYTDSLNKRGGANYTYIVCELNTTATCTNSATATF